MLRRRGWWDVGRSQRAPRGLLSGIALPLALVATGAAGARPPTAEIHAFSPEADTYVTATLPDENFGRSPVLRADGDPKQTTFLRFRLEKLKGEITSVTLLLHAQTKARATYQVRRVYEDDWRERRLTFENAPRSSLRYVASKPVRKGIWSAVDVSSFVTDDTEVVSLAVTTRSTRGVAFASRESGRGPRLVIRTERNRSKGIELTPP
jgi:hypothetical protein